MSPGGLARVPAACFATDRPSPKGRPIAGVKLAGAGARGPAGGADRDRTGDLLVANQALSQLSYSPEDGGPKWI
jgi:hypothetical protein